MPKNKFAILLIAFAVFLSNACRDNSADLKPIDVPNNQTTNQTAPTETKTYDTKVKFKTPDDKDVLEIKSDGGNIKLEFGGKVIRSELKGDKRKYFYEAGSQIAEVKAKDADGFKVRTTDGKLLWKIKIADDKIKISDNEENQNPFEIKKKDDGAKVEFNGTKLGEVKFYKDREKIKVKDANDQKLFDSNTDKYSVAYGVLLIDKIPEELRFIIIGELLNRNL